MEGIRLYNSETERHRSLFGAIVHEVLSAQVPRCVVIEPSDSRYSEHLSLSQEGTEHLLLDADQNVIYSRSYLAVSTSPEAGVNRRLNRIGGLPTRVKKGVLTRAILALGIECPRDCLTNVVRVGERLGDSGVQFELWEAKDLRRRIKGHLNIICPAFHRSHLEQLTSRRQLKCALLPPRGEGDEDPDGRGSESPAGADDLGTLFVSHASEDKSFVDQLVQHLDRFACRVWYDKREILVGDRITARINEGLAEATAIIAVLSRASVSKPWVLLELGAGINMGTGKSAPVVLPVLKEECSIPPLLRDICYADFTVSFQRGFNQLLVGLQGIRRSFQPRPGADAEPRRRCLY